MRDFGSGKNSNGFTDGISAVHYAVWYYVSGRLSSKDAQNGGRSFPSVLGIPMDHGRGEFYGKFSADVPDFCSNVRFMRMEITESEMNGGSPEEIDLR